MTRKERIAWREKTARKKRVGRLEKIAKRLKMIQQLGKGLLREKE